MICFIVRVLQVVIAFFAAVNLYWKLILIKCFKNLLLVVGSKPCFLGDSVRSLLSIRLQYSRSHVNV
jgi:hypothetical protein